MRVKHSTPRPLYPRKETFGCVLGARAQQGSRSCRAMCWPSRSYWKKTHKKGLFSHQTHLLMWLYRSLLPTPSWWVISWEAVCRRFCSHRALLELGAIVLFARFVRARAALLGAPHTHTPDKHSNNPANSKLFFFGNTHVFARIWTQNHLRTMQTLPSDHLRDLGYKSEVQKESQRFLDTPGRCLYPLRCWGTNPKLAPIP